VVLRDDSDFMRGARHLIELVEQESGPYFFPRAIEAGIPLTAEVAARIRLALADIAALIRIPASMDAPPTHLTRIAEQMAVDYPQFDRQALRDAVFFGYSWTHRQSVRPGRLRVEAFDVTERRIANDGNEVVPTVVIDGVAVTNPPPALVKERIAALS